MVAIPLKLVTGFLGSGKTTFLMHYIDSFSKDRKIGVIQNEFSGAGVDGLIIRSNSGVYRMLEINNGSVFCVCLLGSFIDSLAAFIDDNHPDEIIMEASGMSDPVSIGQIFQSNKLCNKVYLERTFAIVDACNFNKLTFIRQRLEHQIRIADLTIVNKCDLPGIDMDSVINAVTRINPYAQVIKSTFSSIDFSEVHYFDRLNINEIENESCRPDLQSMIIKTSRLISPEMLWNFIDSVKGDFIRCKGFVNTGKNRKMIVQGTFDNYTIEHTEWFPGVTELVGIGRLTKPENYTRKFEKFCITL